MEKGRTVDADPLNWEKFIVVFLENLFPWDVGGKGSWICQTSSKNMTAMEYVFKFTQLSWYAPTMIVDPRERMIKKYPRWQLGNVIKLFLWILWEFLISWSIFNKLKRRNLRKGLGRQRELRLVMVISHIEGLMDMFVLSFDKFFPVRFLQCSF